MVNPFTFLPLGIRFLSRIWYTFWFYFQMHINFIFDLVSYPFDSHTNAESYVNQKQLAYQIINPVSMMSFYNQCVVAMHCMKTFRSRENNKRSTQHVLRHEIHRYYDTFSILKMFNYSKQTRYRLVKSNLAQLFTICSFNPLVIHF